MPTSYKIQILNTHKNINWLTFNQAYSPLLNKEDVLLFMNLVFQAAINNQMGVENQNYSTFLDNYQLDEKLTQEALLNLKDLELIEIKNNRNKITIEIQKIKPLHELMNNDDFHKKLKQALKESKYLEIVSFTGSIEMEDEEQLEKQTFANFYNGVLDLIGTEFTLCPKVIKIIREYEKLIPMDVLQNLAYLSIVKESEKYRISPHHFSFLLKKENNNKSDDFNLSDHRNFWSALNVENEKDIHSEFERLFEKHNPLKLYKLLTSRDQLPNNLQKWMKSCIQEKGFNYPLVNALMSFVMSLLGKVPVNYLIKVSETLSNNYSPNKIGLINLVKKVIESDLKNGKNRLNVKKLSKNTNQAIADSKKTNDFIYYF